MTDIHEKPFPERCPVGRRERPNAGKEHHARRVCQRRERQRAGTPHASAALRINSVGLISYSQATLYKMAQRLLTEDEHVQTVTYSLPNKHYIPVDMKYIGLDNLTP